MENVEYARHGVVALISLDRPERLNALSRALLEDLADAFAQAQDDPEVRAIVLAANGRAFCAGVDLKEMTETSDGGLQLPDISPRVNPLLPVRDPRIDKPVVTAINGPAFGAGFLMMAAGDLCVVADDAIFEISEVVRGSAVGWYEGAQLGLPRAIAMELALGGRIDGRRAYEMGLANRISSREDLVETALELAQGIAARPPLALRFNRTLVHDMEPPVPDEIARKAEKWLEESAFSEDAHESVAAFVEKRQPVYQGR